MPIKRILSHQADVTTIDKLLLRALRRRFPGHGDEPRGASCLASQEMPLPVGLGIDKHQPEFLAWLRAVAKEIKPQVVAAEARVERAGSPRGYGEIVLVSPSGIERRLIQTDGEAK